MTTLVTTEIDPNSVRPGWVALLIVLALGVAMALLMRNMGKQLKRIDFDDPDAARDRAPSDAPATSDSSPDQAGDAGPKATDGPTKAEAEAAPDSETRHHSQH
jgi:hypothetical protein